jgi:hypothetical protein
MFPIKNICPQDFEAWRKDTDDLFVRGMIQKPEGTRINKKRCLSAKMNENE